MHHLYRMRRVFVLCVIAAILGFGATPASAAVTLAAIRVGPGPAGGAIVFLSFTGGLPLYHLTGPGTTETSVIFDGTQLGSVAPSLAGQGPLTSVSVAQTGTNASVALHLASPVVVQIIPAGGGLLLEVPGPNGATGSNVLTPFAGATPTPSILGATTEVVLLKYADVSEIAGVLVAGSTIASNDTFTPEQTNIGTSSLTGSSFGGVTGTGITPAQTPNFSTAFGQTTGLAQRVNDNIAVDRRLNAIILSGTPDVIAGLKDIIEKLDIPVPSVILETQVVELDDSAARNIGIDTSPDGTGILVNGQNSTTSTLGSGTTTRPNGYALGSGVSGSGAVSLQANLYAQITLGNGKVIARPRILAQSGQEASILTGDALPIVTNVVLAGASSISTQQVNYVNVGVNLQIQPRVSSDGYVTSHIYSEVSSVTSFNSIGAPEISQRTASTIATVKDGDSFVIGGLLQDNETSTLSKLPFIGDLPLIGQLFQHINTSHTQTNLYIIVTPHIVVAGGANPPVQPLVPPPSLPQLAPPPPPGASAGSQPLVAPTSAPTVPSPKH